MTLSLIRPTKQEIRNPSKKIEEWISLLTPEEKAALCSGRDVWSTKPVKRLGIPGMLMADGPHGVRKQIAQHDNIGLFDSLPATCFPTASALAASWNRELLEEVGAALAEECRQEGVRVLLGPGVNIKRSPLCGRNFEYFSEDPFITAELASAMILGIQSKGVSACLKHFAANNQEKYRMIVDAVIDERALHEIYLEAFVKTIAKANPWSLMVSYNKLNGEYTGESCALVQEILRGQWGYQGLVMSDWGGTNNRVQGLLAGVDLEMPSSGSVHDPLILEAIQAERLPMELLNASVRRILRLAAHTESKKRDLYRYSRAKHHLLAKKAAGECVVLLKNGKQRSPIPTRLPLLPLQKGQTVALIGQFARHPRYQGAGSSQIHPTRLENIYQAAKTEWKNAVFYAKGYHRNSDHVDAALIREAKELALQADVAVILAGLPDSYESEGFDRAHLKLPPNHTALIEEIASVHSNVVVVLQNGAPVEMPWIKKVTAVVEAYLTGQAGAGALWDILTGKTNPSGKLAETFPLRLEDNGSFPYFPMGPRHVEYRESLFVGYRYYEKARQNVLFPFGHGLSYTSFRYSDPACETEVLDFSKKNACWVSVTVENAGERFGAEVVQLYVRGHSDRLVRPEKELKGFEKVFLHPKEKKRISFFLDTSAFSCYSVPDHSWKVVVGVYDIQIGSSCADIRLSLPLSVEAPADKTLNLKIHELYLKKEENYFRSLLEKPAVTREEFYRFIGRKIPQTGSDSILYHRNSTLGECQGHWLCRLIYRLILFHIRRMTKGNPSQIDTMKQVLAELPLRGLVLMSNGAFMYRYLDVIILWMNKQRLKAIELLLFHRLP